MKRFQVAVIGSGPAGQKAAIQAAKAGQSVVMIERDRLVGGACVHRGTIPSKTLRETALHLSALRDCGDFVSAEFKPNMEVAALMQRLEDVTCGHAHVMNAQLVRNDIHRITGRASFGGINEIIVTRVREPELRIQADTIVIATGSRPRKPPEIPVDHEHILDSDSILSMVYLPKSLCVLGAGVIASEYASIFAALGTEVTIVDSGQLPVAFMDAELSQSFVSAFEKVGGRYLPNAKVASCEWDGVGAVETKTADGACIRSEKVLCALGRLANVEGLGLETLGVELSKRKQIVVNEHCQTSVPNIYAVGDVIGFPALASTSMEQGRRAVCHALGLPPSNAAEHIPVGIYTIPAMSCVGLTEEQVRTQYGSCTVGRAHFAEVARGKISDSEYGLLKIVACPKGEKILGAHIVGSDACELIHIAQVAIISQWTVEMFIDNIFNFPTLAEAYRIAALDLVNRGRQAALDEKQSA